MMCYQQVIIVLNHYFNSKYLTEINLLNKFVQGRMCLLTHHVVFSINSTKTFPF